MIDVKLVEALQRVAHNRRLLVACDYDGTLSPIVDDPSAAVAYAPAVTALVALADFAQVGAVIISGRSPETLAALVNTPSSVTLIGDHGARLSVVDPEAGRTVEAVSDALVAAAGEFEGVMVESKSLGGAFHYRHAADPEGAADAARAIGGRLGTRVIEGKQVVELLVGAGDKGAAISRLRVTGPYDCVVFFGDDVTDEDAFAVLGDDDVGVKVGDGATVARYRVTDPVGVADALEILCSELRSAGR